jgi:hypothetical protein
MKQLKHKTYNMKYRELQPCDIPHIVDDDPDDTIGDIK